MSTIEEIRELQAKLNKAIAELDDEPPQKTAAKRPSARRAAPAATVPPRPATKPAAKPQVPAKGHKPAAKLPSLAKFQPAGYSRKECVCGPGGKNFPSYSLKLAGKDELLVVWCPEHKCSHYFLAQPNGDTFVVFELNRGKTMISSVKPTPSGDMATEVALEKIELKLEDSDFDEEAFDADAEEEE